MASDYEYKIVILGSSGVGKTSLMLQFADKAFSPYAKSTVGVDFKTVYLCIGPDRVKLSLWDLAGDSRFTSITQRYYRGASACLLVYDITKKETFASLTQWVKNFQEHTGPQSLVMVVGNKCDLDHLRLVEQTDGLDFCKQHGYFFMETSAATAINVQKAFTQLATEIHAKHRKYMELTKALSPALQPGTRIDLSKPPDEQYVTSGRVTVKKNTCC